MPDSPSPVRCDGCGELGRRPENHPCPHHWFFIESVDRTPGVKEGTIYIVWACSEKCRDGLWKKGPGERSIDEEGSQKMRRRLARKDG